MKRRDLIQAGAAAALAAAAPLRSVFAQQKTVWKAADVHPLGYPAAEAVVRMGKKIETATGGRISLQMYPLMQLGGEKEMIEQAQLGALQLARISVGPMGPVVDELNVFNLPFIFRDEGHMRKVIDGPIGDELLGRISANPRRRSGGCGTRWSPSPRRSSRPPACSSSRPTRRRSTTPPGRSERSTARSASR